MAKDKITRAEYLQLLGLKLLADKHYAALDQINRTAAEVVGAEEEGFSRYYGHVSDCLSDDRISVDEMLRKLGVTVSADDSPTVESLTRELEYAREAAAHFAHCRTCGETSVSSCDEGGREYAIKLGIYVPDEAEAR